MNLCSINNNLKCINYNIISNFIKIIYYHIIMNIRINISLKIFIGTYSNIQVFSIKKIIIIFKKH